MSYGWISRTACHVTSYCGAGPRLIWDISLCDTSSSSLRPARSLFGLYIDGSIRTTTFHMIYTLVDRPRNMRNRPQDP